MAEKRTKKLEIRLSPGEMEYLHASAREAGCTVSEYARQIMLRDKAQNPDSPCGFPNGNDSRHERLRIRFTKAEKAWLDERAAWLGCSTPALVRRMLFSGSDVPPVVIDTSQLKKTYFELHRQGVNLNQIARWLNTYKKNANAGEVVDVLQRIEKQLDTLDAILEDIQSQEKRAMRKGKDR